MLARRLGLLSVITVILISGCHELDLMPAFLDKEKAREKERQENIRHALMGEEGHSKLIGDYIKISDGESIKVQGVGFVDHLDGTGEDPPASNWRTMLVEDMRRHNVKDPNTVLHSSNSALVIVTAIIPPVLKKGEKVDLIITPPDGSEFKSLAGGWLMPCRLKERMAAKGEVHEGREICLASGAVLVDALGGDSETATSGLRRGRIPGGGVYTGDDRLLGITVQSEYRGVKMSTKLANRIGARFHDYDDHGIQRPLAKAKSDAHLELIVHERYRDNYPRYLQCIRNVALRETAVEKHMRLQQLANEIKFGPTAEAASLQLEAIGADAIPTLKLALKSPDLEARFHAGMALAYLGNSDGVPALKEAADKEPAFRIFAFAALATLQDGSAAEALRDLMNHESIETRYGAFRSLSTLAPNDPSVKGLPMNGEFSLHPVISTARPLIHLTRYKKAEIVVFNESQEFLSPLMLRAGNHVILHNSAEPNKIVIKRIAPQERDQERVVSSRVVDVIKTVAEMGANYPDIVSMLLEAESQKNLPGQIAIDRLPQSGRIYIRPLANRSPLEGNAEGTESVQMGGEGLRPNLFQETPDEKSIIDATELPPPSSNPPGTPAASSSGDLPN